MGARCEADRGHRLAAERELARLVERAVQEGIIGGGAAGEGADERGLGGAEDGEHGPHLGGLQTFVEIVEQDIVGMSRGWEEADVAAPEADDLFEVRPEEGEIRLDARLRPGGEGQSRGELHLGHEPGGHAGFLLEIAGGGADQARVVGIGVERAGERLECIDQAAEFGGGGEFVNHARERGELVAAGFGRGGGQIHLLIPRQETRDRVEVGDFGQQSFQAREFFIHGGDCIIAPLLIPPFRRNGGLFLRPRNGMRLRKNLLTPKRF
jgi:hypothetical protein